ncbi:valine--tRNA ligase [Patescibacteria group bacterium]
MLGDTAVAMSTKDKRYRDILGGSAILPITGREIPIIEDEAIDKEFGTGLVKVTPAHDPLDFEIGERNKLEQIMILDAETGKTNENVPEDLRGLTMEEAREKVIAQLEAEGLIEKIEDHKHSIGYCHRCKTTIEPIISLQWFIDVDAKKFSLKKESMKAINSGRIKLYPARFEKIFLKWMEDLHDWTISRQLWWGHQIPVYYCESCGDDKPIVSSEAPTKCPECGGTKLRQDPDTLDTWFSSGQWAYTTLGFTHEGAQPADMKDFYPSDMMVMGRDILFFWSARMVMMSLYATGQEPFKRLYYTGLIQDKDGQKMSKSKGNGIDPLEAIDKYGADAIRIAFLSNMTAGNDFRMYYEKIESYRNFINKLWNITRFTQMRKPEDQSQCSMNLTLADRWILSRLQDLIAQNTKDLDLDRLEIAMPTTRMYSFLWDDFADWYLEAKKIEDPDAAENCILESVLEVCLKMLHPYIPFITEQLWERIGHDSMLMTEAWPESFKPLIDKKSERDFELIRDAITAIRNARSEYKIAPTEPLEAILPKKKLFTEQKDLIEKMARCTATTGKKQKGMISRSIGKETLLINLAGKIDAAAERARAEKEQAEATKFAEQIEKKLANKNFTKNAPKEIIEKEKAKLETQKARLKEIAKRLKELESL